MTNWFKGGLAHKTAIISDIHSNLEAFTAVLAEIDRLDIRTIYALGDIVGYGPDPEECTRLAAKHCAVRVMGNHEYTLVNPERMAFNPQAKQALNWTRTQLTHAGLLKDATELESYYKHGNQLFVHGSVRNVVFDYLTETDRNGFSSFDEVLDTLAHEFTGFDYCFVGHNHRPFLATREGFLHPHDDVNEFGIAHEKLYVSVGSVGQPRDGDPRACFVVCDGNTIHYHRVPYDTKRTMSKILSAGLPSSLAYRLLNGV